TTIRVNTSFTASTFLAAGLTPVGGLPNPAGSTANSDSQLMYGPTIGAGFEYAWSKNLTLGAEYRYTHYGERGFQLGPNAGGFIPSTPPGPLQLSLDSQELTARLSYFFH